MASKGYKGLGMDGFIGRSYNKSVQAQGIMEQYKIWAQNLMENIPDAI
jgi:hypothetical protein